MFEAFTLEGQRADKEEEKSIVVICLTKCNVEWTIMDESRKQKLSTLYDEKSIFIIEYFNLFFVIVIPSWQIRTRRHIQRILLT